MGTTLFDAKRIAEGYRNRPYLHGQVIEQFLAFLSGKGEKTHFQSGLDIGCGAGLSTKALKQICDRVIGTDISPQMIAVAKSVCENQAGYDFQVCQAESVDFPAESVDIVTAAGAIQWIAQKPFLERMQKIMKKDSYLLIYDFAISDKMQGGEDYTSWWHEKYLKEFPRPKRNDAVWLEEEVAPLGFHILFQDTICMPYSFSLEKMIAFMMIQSNVNVQIEEQGRDMDEIKSWFQSSLSEVFGGMEKIVFFKGYLWILKRDGNFKQLF